MTSYAMQYNRLNWPLLLMLALAVLIEPRQRLTRPVAILEGAAAGAVTALLCAGKINFAVAAFAILFLAWLVRRHGAAFWLSFSAVLAALMGLYLFYLRGDIAAYCQDLAMLRRLHPFPTVARTLLGILLASIPEFCGLALIIFVQLRASSPRGAVDRRCPIVARVGCPGWCWSGWAWKSPSAPVSSTIFRFALWLPSS